MSERRGVQLPCREVLAALRHRRFKIAEHVNVNSGLWCFLVFRWYQVNTAQCFILTIKSEFLKARTPTTDAYNVSVLVFIEYVQSGSQSPAKDSWILWEVSDSRLGYIMIGVSRTRDDCQIAPEVSQAQFGYIKAINENPSRGGLNKAEK